MKAGELSLDRRARRVTLGGAHLDMTPKALAVLEYLMTHPDEAVGRERLLDAVLGWEYPAVTRTVDTRMAELVEDRKVLVSESGINTYDDISKLAAAGVSAVLVGESLMRSPDIGAKVRELFNLG